MVAGASSQKMIYRSFEEINGRNQWAGIQGVEYTMASSGKAFGIGLVQAREDQFEYGAPQDFGYTGSGFVMYVSENGAIRIEEKALVGLAQRPVHPEGLASRTPQLLLKIILVGPSGRRARRRYR